MTADESELPPIRPGTVSVIVTVLNDPRVAHTIDSLLAQTRPPDEIWIDDGGGPTLVKDIVDGYRGRAPTVHYLYAPGNVAESRNQALTVVQGEFTAFIDADEVAPPGWLEQLTAAFADPKVGFAGGPTPATAGTARRRAARFYDGHLRRFYDVDVRRHPYALPMGNSMWRTRLFRELGPLETFGGRRIGGEDLEFGLRAYRAGWRGAYVAEATVDHDFSDVTLSRVLRKTRRYSEGGYSVWRRYRATSEATVVRLLPYATPFALAIVGAVLLIPHDLRRVGIILLILALASVVVLVVVLTLRGRELDPRYPGLRYGGLEVLRRWATMYGALRGVVRRARA
jgi:cellulose synthase/poly-beta-1,6-N-acetylglucosamine synthase-like glycosyltransferase